MIFNKKKISYDDLLPPENSPSAVDSYYEEQAQTVSLFYLIKRVIKTFIFFSFLLFIIIAGLALYNFNITSKYILKYAFNQLNVPVESFLVTDAGKNSLVLENVKIKGGSLAEKAILNYSLDNLILGKVNKIDIIGLKVKLDADNNVIGAPLILNSVFGIRKIVPSVINIENFYLANSQIELNTSLKKTDDNKKDAVIANILAVSGKISSGEFNLQGSINLKAGEIFEAAGDFNLKEKNKQGIFELNLKNTEGFSVSLKTDVVNSHFDNFNFNIFYPEKDFNLAANGKIILKKNNEYNLNADVNFLCKEEEGKICRHFMQSQISSNNLKIENDNMKLPLNWHIKNFKNANYEIKDVKISGLFNLQNNKGQIDVFSTQQGIFEAENLNIKNLGFLFNAENGFRAEIEKKFSPIITYKNNNLDYNITLKNFNSTGKVPNFLSKDSLKITSDILDINSNQGIIFNGLKMAALEYLITDANISFFNDKITVSSAVLKLSDIPQININLEGSVIDDEVNGFLVDIKGFSDAKDIAIIASGNLLKPGQISDLLIKTSKINLEKYKSQLPMFNYADNASGYVSIIYNINQKEEYNNKQIKLALDNVQYEAKGLNAQGVFGVLNLKSLFPMISSGEQEIYIKNANNILPLLNGNIKFYINEEDLLINSGNFDLFDVGFVSIMPSKFNKNTGEGTVILDLPAVNLENINNITKLDFLELQGRLKGIINLNINNQGQIIDKLNFENISFGKIKYQGEIDENLPTNIKDFLKVIKNYGFNKLKISSTATQAERDNIEVNLVGANPDLYDGNEIKLNIGFEENIAKLMKKNESQEAKIPDYILQSLTMFNKELSAE